MLALEIGLPLELDHVADLKSLDPAHYGGHPALKIPTLHVDGRAIWGTSDICRKLVALRGGEARRWVVLPDDVESDLARNAQELVWQGMSTQVSLVIGVMLSKLPADAVLFAKAARGMHGSLAWLDANLDEVLAQLPASRRTSVLELGLHAWLEHIVFRPTVSLEGFERLAAFSASFGRRASALQTPYETPPVAPAQNLK